MNRQAAERFAARVALNFSSKTSCRGGRLGGWKMPPEVPAFILANQDDYVEYSSYFGQLDASTSRRRTCLECSTVEIRCETKQRACGSVEEPSTWVANLGTPWVGTAG